MGQSTSIELILPPDTYEALQQAAQQTHKSEAELALEAIQLYLKQLAAVDPLLGLFTDEAELIAQVAEDAMRSRETTPLRVGEVTGG
jgi:predicted transcriptional regulator